MKSEVYCWCAIVRHNNRTMRKIER